MRKLFLSVFLLVAIGCGSLNAQPSKTLLGIPFGEKLSVKNCPSNMEKSKVPCWMAPPFVHKPTGVKIGSVFLPNPKNRPVWAEHAIFFVSLDRQGRVQTLKVNTFISSERYEIARSISQRFGEPRVDELRQKGASWASWKSEEGCVDLQCTDECWTEFRTPTAQAEREAGQRNSAKVDASRPKAP